MTHRWDLIAAPITGLVHPVRVDPTGLSGPTRAQARSKAWRTVAPNQLVPAEVTDAAVEQRILEAYARAGGDVVVTGWASLRLQGGGFFDGLDRDGRTRLDVPIAANGSRLRSRAGIQVRRFQVPPDEIVVVHGIRCTCVERALLDEMCRVQRLRDQVVAADMTFAAQLTSIRRMQRYRWTRYWYRDIRTLDRVLPLCDENAASRPEVDFRLVWELDAHWSHPLVNRTVLATDGKFVAIPDLLDPHRHVAGEYAGGDHRNIDQHESDLDRGAALRRVGLEIVEVVRRDLEDPELVTSRMEEAASRAALLPHRWQLGPGHVDLDALLDRRDAIRGVE
jgi:hypothetical protein